MKIGWSKFATEKNASRDGSYFLGSPETLIELVEKHWSKRRPGAAREDMKMVTIVPIEESNLAEMFGCPWAHIKDATSISASVVRRQPHEDPYVELRGIGKALPVKYVKIVLYSAAALLENNGTRSGDYDWEIVAILAGPWEDEPMMPLTMARNYLQEVGGTYAPYSAEDFAKSIYFWSQYVKVVTAGTDQPYITVHRVEVEKMYNGNYGDDRECKCGHPYYRHFDTYENMYPVGCKYCGCYHFEEAPPSE